MKAEWDKYPQNRDMRWLLVILGMVFLISVMIESLRAEEPWDGIIPLITGHKLDTYSEIKPIGIPIDIMRAMGRVESNCGDSRYMRGDDGKSVGYFQVKLSTAKLIYPKITKKDLMKNKYNYLAAKAYLQHCLERYNNLDYALICYNAGEGVADIVKHPRRCKNKNAACYVKKIYAFIKESKLCDLSDIIPKDGEIL